MNRFWSFLVISLCLVQPGIAHAESRERDFWPNPDQWTIKDAGPPDVNHTVEGGFVCDVYFSEPYIWPDKYPAPDTKYVGPEMPYLTDDVMYSDMPISNKDAGVGGDGGLVPDDLDGGCSLGGGARGHLPVGVLLVLLTLIRRRL